jgi:PAS domain S-box-containing protein
MDFLFFDDVRKKPVLIPALILASSIASLLLNVYGLTLGVTNVLPHLLYIPIILTAYYYPRRGVLFACILSVCYCVVSFIIVTPATAYMLSAIARACVFVLIAAVVSYLSGRMYRDTQMCRRLVSVIRSSGEAITGEDADGIITDWNAGAEQLYGYVSGEIVGRSISDIIPPELREEKKEMLEKIRQGRTVERFETERIRKDGTRIQVSLSLSPILDDTGEFAGVSTIAHDITESTRIGRLLEESEAKFREIFNSANDAIQLHEVDERGLPGKFIDVNDVACRMLLYSKEELLEKSPLDLTTSYHSRPLEEIGEEIKTRGSTIFETEHRRKDGVIIPVEVSVHIVVIQGRRMVLSIIRDLTRRKRDEAAFRRLSADHKAIIDHAPAMIWYKDTKNTFVRVNPAGAEAFGMAIEEIEGKSAYELFPDRAGTYYKDDLDVITSGIPQLGIVEQMTTARGDHLWVQADKIPIRDEQGTVTGILLFIVDITERKRADDDLRMLNKKLSLLSGITRHDISNQLMALNAYIELSTDAIDNPPELRDFFAQELKITGVIAEQISFARDYEEIGTKSPVWQDVSVLVRDAGAVLPLGNIRLETRCPGLEVYADPLLEKVFYNLIDNSLHYGGDTLTTIRVTAGVQGEALRIIVEDDGGGISAIDKQYLFTKGFGRHTGLGLFLSREILSITGISITENGIPGKGVRFEITVPKGEYRYPAAP